MDQNSTTSFYCPKCKKTLKAGEFYSSNNLEKYPNGKVDKCKKCLTMHVDNWNPDTYLWILQELDVPFIPEEWNKLMAKYATPDARLTGTTILGRYLSKMKLNQWSKYRWKDNEFIQELNNNLIEQTMTAQGYDAAEIAKAVMKASFPMPQEELSEPEYVAPVPVAQTGEPSNYFEQVYEETAFDLGLTDEDITYLKLKWGKGYRPDEWVSLEQLYEEMLQSYDIQAAGDLNTLKLACKSSLKANQLLDIGDIEGAQKATKMYDSLMKSGKWTAAQNKVEENELVDSVGEIVAICERDGFIPRFYVSGPQDHVDRTIEDLQRYTHDLITNEHGLSQMMETALKQIEEEGKLIAAAANSDEEDEEAKLFDYDNGPAIDDQDFSDFKDFQNELEQEDQVLLDILGKGDN